MGAFAFPQEPDYVGHLAARQLAGAMRISGLAERWNMPVALFDVRGGFEHRTDPDIINHHTIKWRASGAQVFAQTGRGASVADPMTDQAICIQSRGSQARYWATSDLTCAHVYWPEALTRMVAASLFGGRGDRADIMRDDVPFADDILLSRMSKRYFARAFDQDMPCALEMDARAAAMAGHLVAHHSALAGLKAPSSRPRLTPAQTMRALDCLSGDLTEPPRLSRVAKEAGVSEFHFCRAFAEHVGMPPHRWLTHVRMERAKHLLATSRLSVIGIAERCGYSDPSYFARAFRRATGVAPLSFRAQR